MAATLATEDVESVDTFLAEAIKYIFKQKSYDEFDELEFVTAIWRPSQRISMWLGCHTAESVRKDWDSSVGQILRASGRIARIRRHLARVRPELQTSDRAGMLLKIRFETLGVHVAEFHTYWTTLKRALNVLDKQTPPSEVTPADVSQQTSTQRALELARIWLERPRKTGGPTEGQQRFVAAILGKGGAMSHADVNVTGGFDWDNPRKGATNMARRINGRLSEYGQLWSIIPEDNSRCLIVLDSDLESRS